MLKVQERNNALIYLSLITALMLLVISNVSRAQPPDRIGRDVDAWFQNHDLDGNSNLSLDEFKAWIPHLENGMARGMFDRMDQNGDNTIQIEEVREAGARRNQRCQERFQKSDLDGDGKLSFEEFQSGHKHRVENRAQSIFKKIDANGDGYLQHDELQAMRAQRHERHGNKQNRKERFRKRDLNGDGKLSFEEFKAGHKNRRANRTQEMFQRVDANGDGYIQHEEALTMHARMQERRGNNPPPPDIFNEFDLDGDSKLSFDEFGAGHEKHRANRDQEMFQRADANGDGYIQLDEMLAMRPPPPERDETYASSAESEEASGVSSAPPVTTTLNSVYPNPFNPTTSLKISLQEAGYVELCIYDINGRLVQTLHQGSLSPGDYTFAFDGSGYASGVYFVQLRAGENVSVQKMLLSK